MVSLLIGQLIKIRWNVSLYINSVVGNHRGDCIIELVRQHISKSSHKVELSV